MTSHTTQQKTAKTAKDESCFASRSSRPSVQVLLCCLPLLVLVGCDEPGGCPNCPSSVVAPFVDERPQVNLPHELREWNWGGGSCVHASHVMALRWQNQLELAQWWRATFSGEESYHGLTSKMERAGVPYLATHTGDVDFLEWCVNGAAAP